MKHIMVHCQCWNLQTDMLRRDFSLHLMMVLIVFDRLAGDFGHPLLFKGDLAIELVQEIRILGIHLFLLLLQCQIITHSIHSDERIRPISDDRHLIFKVRFSFTEGRFPRPRVTHCALQLHVEIILVILISQLDANESLLEHSQLLADVYLIQELVVVLISLVLLPPLVIALSQLALLQVALEIVLVPHPARADRTRRRELPSQVLCKSLQLQLLLILIGSEDGGDHQNFNGGVSRIIGGWGTYAFLKLFHGQGLSVEGIYVHAVLERDLLDVALGLKRRALVVLNLLISYHQ